MAFDVRLMDQGSNKIWTIKALRTAFPPMGLFEAKTTVDQAPVTIAVNIDGAEVERIKGHFDGIARIEIKLSKVTNHLTKFNKVTVDLPEAGISWINIAELKVGEIVSCVQPSFTQRGDLRIITENGAMSLDGKIVSQLFEKTSYQRLPIGTKVVLTVI